MGFGVHTALINLHPVLKMGSNCVGCTGHKAHLETILFYAGPALLVATHLDRPSPPQTLWRQCQTCHFKYLDSHELYTFLLPSPLPPLCHLLLCEAMWFERSPTPANYTAAPRRTVPGPSNLCPAFLPTPITTLQKLKG